MRWLQCLVAGVVFSAIGGLVVVAAISTDTPELLWVAWGTGALGSALVLVGLIAVGVKLGVQDART